jgi:diguanylate cyclase (GGDEF)-like protein
MNARTASDLSTRILRMLRSFRRPHMLALMPLLVLSALALGGTSAMIFVALAFPVALAVALPSDPGAAAGACDPLTGLAQRQGVVAALDIALRISTRMGRSTGAMMIEIDRFKLLEERHDRVAIERILRVTAERLGDTLREDDLAARLEGPTFAVALAPVRRLDLEAAIQLAGRIQRALSEPISVDATNVYVTVSIGFSIATRLHHPTGETVLQAATSAMIEAQRSGPSAIRSYSDAMRARIASRNSLSDDVAGALERGEIMAFFQPQISTKTGNITGFESLARWHHPERGLIPPIEFLPALEQAGLMDRLGEIMIYDALTALKHWDDQGFDIPRVSVNFSNEELCDPRLVDRIGWELDRFDLTPDRLVVEVLETVVATHSEDVVIRNLSGLARLGCCLDLDDFGTGHASITNIRRFSIERIKIDRSFVTKIDADPEQQKMVSAILTMADRLGLDTLAEGVETTEEQAMLARLGCGHLQGFGIARPMPMQETDGWITTYRRRQDHPITLPRRAV